jgi:tetratricopeptide (TPR) repeat protein
MSRATHSDTPIPQSCTAMDEKPLQRWTPQNPLGVIALFVFLIETIATVSLHSVADKEFAIVLVWFIVGYPIGIAVCFFLLLAFKREALYGPKDYDDPKTFGDLLRKVARIEAKQAVEGIDETTALKDVLSTVDRLIAVDDVWSAISVGRSFLKQHEYGKSVKVLEHIKTGITPANNLYYKTLANIAYSEIGLKRYENAISLLLEVKRIKRGKHFQSWHGLTLAYAYFMAGKKNECDETLKWVKGNGVSDVDLEFFANMYPEIAEKIDALED